MPDPLIASAFVRIKPEPKSVSAFSKEVRGSIEKSLTARPIKVPVIAKLTPFKKVIQSELSAATFTIKVIPVLAPGFKAQVSRLAKTAAAGVTVPVAPVGRGAVVPLAAAAKAPAALVRTPVSTAASREAAFQKQLVTLANARTASERALAKVEETEGTAKDRLAAASRALSKAESILEKHEVTRIAISESLTKKQQARLNSAVRLAQADVTAAAAARSLIASTIEEADANLRAEATAAARGKTLLEISAIEQKLATAQVLDSTITNKVSQAKARLTAVTAVDTSAKRLNAEASAAAAASLTVEDAEAAKLTASLVAVTEAEVTKAKGAVESAIADKEAAASAAERAAVEKQLARGLLATALAAAGARGATLAAGTGFLAGAAVATGLFKSVQAASRLQVELNVFRVTAHATAAEMDAVSEKSKQLGNDLTLPAVSANDAANAMTELAKAGLSVQDSMAAARGTLQLATAAQLDNQTAVNITASALNAFGLAGNQAVHVADLLAGASDAAQGGIADMGGALSSVAAVARQAGVSIEDTIAFITLLAKNGIQGAEAGTALRVALIRLIAPTKDASEVLGKLGVNVLDSLGNVRPQIFADIADATNQMGAAQRNAALQTIFGTRAIRAQAVLGRENIQGLNQIRDATNQDGLAAELAAARTEGFAGKVESLKNSASTAGVSLGQILIPALSLLAQGLNADIILTGKFIEGLQKIDKLGDVKIPGTDTKTGGFFKGFRDAVGSVGVELDKLTTGIPGLSGFFDPVTKQSQEAKNNLDDLSESIAAVTGNLTPLASQIQQAFGGKAVDFGGGRSNAVKFVQDLEKKITDTTPHAEELKAFLEGIVRSLTALGRAPTDIELKALFDTGSIPDELIKIQGRVSEAPPIVVPAGFKVNAADVKSVAKDSVVFLEHAGDIAAQRGAANASNIFKSAFGDSLTTGAAAGIFDPFMLQAVPSADAAAKEAAKQFAESFSDRLGDLQVKGASDFTQRAFAQALLPGAERRFARAQEAFRKDPTDKNKKAFLDFARGRLKEIQDAIAQTTGDIQSKEKAATDKLAAARNKADQDFLDALGLRRGNIENQILRAEGTAGLDDDIKTHILLRNLLKKKIDEAQKTIKDATLRAQTVQSLTADLIAENQKLRDLNTQLIESISQRFQARLDIAQIVGTVGSIRKIYAAWIDALQKALGEATKGSKIAQQLKLAILQTQQSAFDAINEGFDLDVQIAQAQDRPKAEIRARERFIAQLRREQDQFKKGTLEWKRLELKILEQQKAIDDARKANDKLNRAFSEMAFSFLTTQQGFAANVFGNLLPIGAIGGTVAGNLAAKAAGSAPSSSRPSGGGGGGLIASFSPTGDHGDAEMARAAAAAARGDTSGGGGRGPGDALAEHGRVAAAERMGGFTASQAATLIALTRQIVMLLGGIHHTSKHPEAKRSHQQNKAAMDGMGN